GTLSQDKNELLFSEFGINYNEEPEIFKKGSVVIRDKELIDVVDSKGVVTKRTKTIVKVVHRDIIKEKFWDEHPEILRGKVTRSERKALLQEQREVELAAEPEASL
ncbi:tRNA-His guanylyltransferase, partial [Kickxella alabastrina]